jgi:hypothetical protein
VCKSGWHQILYTVWTSLAVFKVAKRLENAYIRQHPSLLAYLPYFSPSNNFKTKWRIFIKFDTNNLQIETTILNFFYFSIPCISTWQQVTLICLSIYLWLYSRLLDLGRFFSFLILYTVGWTPWRGDQPVERPPLPTHKINAHRHPYLEWDSNPRSHCSSGRRRFIP